MKISASDVKKLRDATGSGMMDCKKALVEAEGDFAKAEKILKKMGLAQIDKRSNRATENGRNFIAIGDNKAVVLEINCETDFVARNKDFIATGEKMADKILKENLTEVNDELKAMLTDLISTIKENMVIKGFKTLEAKGNTMFGQYVHGEGSIAGIVQISSDKKEALENDEVKAFAFDCALHIVANEPLFLSKDTVDASYKAEQEEIFAAQAANLGKPEKVLKGIIAGKLNKFLSQKCFLQQPFVKDDKHSTEEVLKELSKKVGATLKIDGYIYNKVGA